MDIAHWVRVLVPKSNLYLKAGSPAKQKFNHSSTEGELVTRIHNSNAIDLQIRLQSLLVSAVTAVKQLLPSRGDSAAI
jgi:hypothetical protein